MLEVSVSNCMLVEQAPTAKQLRAELSSSSYIQQVLKLHAKGRLGFRKHLVQRRDAGVPRGQV